MSGIDPAEARRKLVHDARQPLNAIRLIAANVQARLKDALDPEEAAWLSAKLEKLDRQVERISELLDPPA